MLITCVATNATKHRTCDFQVRLSACVDDIAAWMLANRLQLNTGKTELLWCATSRRRQQLPTSALRIGSDVVGRPSQSATSASTATPTSACDSTYRKQLPTASPFYTNCAVSDDQFRRPCTRRSLSHSSCHGWTTAMLCSWAYQPTCTTACSRYSTLLLDRSPAYDVVITSVTDTLASFHWLKAPERVQYKLVTIVYRSLNGTAPHYLAADLRRLSDMPSR